MDSWREGKSGPTSSKPTSTAQALADKISLELESAKEAMSQRMQKQREEAEKRIQEVRNERNNFHIVFGADLFIFIRLHRLI